MPLVKLVLGLAALTLGRQLYWVFVGVAGFAVGVEVATRALGGDPPWRALLAALALGIVGALLLGQVENLATVLIPDTTRAVAYKDAYGLVLLVLVLLLRPQGLFGERTRRL